MLLGLLTAVKYYSDQAGPNDEMNRQHTAAFEDPRSSNSLFKVQPNIAGTPSHDSASRMALKEKEKINALSPLIVERQ